ncbi:hypothetical protein PINS_up001481 [Pythium insidiosum]|nr:hypothetical protein PINS_up001481 [Pythium insidiosum]
MNDAAATQPSTQPLTSSDVTMNADAAHPGREHAGATTLATHNGLVHGDNAADNDAEMEETAIPQGFVDGAPVSDIEIAAMYAGMDFETISSQVAPAPAVAAQPANVEMDSGDDDEEEESDDDEPTTVSTTANPDGDDEDGDEDDDDDDDPQKLRAEIEAAMAKEEAKASGPLKTANEVERVPVREPEVELTADCPIARCGEVLNVSRPGLLVTVKSDANSKPLDEGSVLCFEDRTVLGCVDEVFGPVLMPMYLVRFDNADKIPMQTALNKAVFYATEHTTYIVPEKIRDKGTDASNLFDEEADEAVYSDDEAEAAAKRQHRKRNRGDAAPPQGSRQGHDHSRSSTFSDYQPGQQRGHSGGRGGRGRGRGGHSAPTPPANFGAPVQSQPFGGVTRYTSGGYGQPGAPAYPQPPMPYPPAPHGSYPQAPPPYAPHQFPHGHAQFSTPQYGQPMHPTPPYPAHGQHPGYYHQTGAPGYAPPLPPQPYGGPLNGHQQPPHGQFPPPPPPPSGPYNHGSYRQ